MDGDGWLVQRCPLLFRFLGRATVLTDMQDAGPRRRSAKAGNRGMAVSGGAACAMGIVGLRKRSGCVFRRRVFAAGTGFVAPEWP